MKSKKDKQKISITAINQNNIVKNKATPNLKSFLLKKYISRNNNINNISTLNSLYLKKTFFTKCRNDISYIAKNSLYSLLSTTSF